MASTAAGSSRSKRGGQDAERPQTRRVHGRLHWERQSLEHRILLTATMCLLAFGAVMVYSASSATTLLQGRGNGSGYLIRYLVYGTLGLIVMRVLARDGVAKVHLHHGSSAVRLFRARARGAHPPCRGQHQRRRALDRSAASSSSSPPS